MILFSASTKYPYILVIVVILYSCSMVKDRKEAKRNNLARVACNANQTRLPFTRLQAHDSKRLVIEPSSGPQSLPFHCSYCGDGYKTKAALVSHRKNCSKRHAEADEEQKDDGVVVEESILDFASGFDAGFDDDDNVQEMENDNWKSLPSVVANIVIFFVAMPAPKPCPATPLCYPWWQPKTNA